MVFDWTVIPKKRAVSICGIIPVLGALGLVHGGLSAAILEWGGVGSARIGIRRAEAAISKREEGAQGGGLAPAGRATDVTGGSSGSVLQNRFAILTQEIVRNSSGSSRPVS